jgi:hypothetical protein
MAIDRMFLVDQVSLVGIMLGKLGSDGWGSPVCCKKMRAFYDACTMAAMDQQKEPDFILYKEGERHSLLPAYTFEYAEHKLWQFEVA